MGMTGSDLLKLELLVMCVNKCVCSVTNYTSLEEQYVVIDTEPSLQFNLIFTWIYQPSPAIHNMSVIYELHTDKDNKGRLNLLKLLH